MRKIRIYLLYWLAVFLISGFLFFNKSKHPEETNVSNDVDLISKSSNHIPLVLVLCKDIGKERGSVGNMHRLWRRQKEQVVTLLGSMILSSSLDSIFVILFVESKETVKEMEMLLMDWPIFYKQKLKIEIRYINRDLFTDPMNFWRRCVWAKMFMDQLLPEYDSVVTLDTDMLMLGPVEEFGAVFDGMDDVQAIGCAPELWYRHENSTRTLAGRYGVNTGTLFLNLTRIRATIPEGLGNSMLAFRNSDEPARHDQDSLNVYLASKPEILLEVSARYNFMVWSCLPFGPGCAECDQKGIAALHGADSVFYRNVDPKISVVFETMREATREMHFSLQEILHSLQQKLVRVNQDYEMNEFSCSYFEYFDRYLLHRMREKVKRDGEKRTDKGKI